MINKLLSVILCAALFPNARSQSLKDTVKLQEVFVTSARQVTERAFIFKSIDSIVLTNAVHSDLSDLLQKNSSLYIKSFGAGGLATATFRGTSASHTQVLWNGLNINSPMWGQTDLSLLPVFFTDEVSLFYGSSSLAKTSGGLGGCINLNNTPSWNAGTQVALSQTAGSFGYYLSQLKLGFSKNRFISNTRVIVENAENNFRYFDNVTGLSDYTRQKKADFHKKGFLQEFYYKLNQKQFAGVKVMNIWSDRNLPPIMTFLGADRYENQKDYLLNVVGEWKYYGSISNWSFNSGYMMETLDYILTNTNLGGMVVSFDSERVSHVFSNKLHFQHKFSEKAVLKASADAVFTNATFTDKTEDTGIDVQRSDITMQTSFHYDFSSVLSGYALLQQKMLDQKLMPVIVAAGLEYQLISEENLFFRTNLGRNLHVPNLDDKYFIPGGNPELKPEVGYQADAGVVWNKTLNDIRYQLELTGFASLFKDWIFWQPSEYRYLTADNIDRVFSRGAEVNASIKGDLGGTKYQVRGNYGFTRTTNEEESSESYGMQMIYIPKHIGNLHLFLENGTWSAVVSYHHTGARFASTAEDDVHQMPLYYLLDFGCGKKFDFKHISMDMNFRLNNILNKQYQVIRQRAMPGRNFTMTLGFQFKSGK